MKTTSEMKTTIEKIQAELDRQAENAYARFNDEAATSVDMVLGEIQLFLEMLKSK